MNMKRVILSIVLFAACAVGLSAQTHVADSLLPLSPQAASLARYGEYPVSYATGVPDISIPIYTIKLGSYSLPISISYHASGIKVADVASTVGLGWTLNAGGAISRTVEGAPDFRHELGEADNEGRQYETYYRDGTHLGELIAEAADTDGSSLYNLQYMAIAPDIPEFDTASDRYTYNFAGKGGVFRYSHADGGFVPLGYHPFHIDFVRGQAWDLGESYFYIADTDGTDYIFGKTERTGVADDENRIDVSTWYLTKISSGSGDITFRYTEGQEYVWSTYSEKLNTGTYYTYKKSGDGTWDMTEVVDSRTEGRSVKYTCRPVLLSAIEWDGNEIRFTYADDREDKWKTRLVRIEVVNRDGEVLKTVTLGNASYWGNNNSNKRMMLRSVTLSDEGEYSFDYDTSRGYLPSYRVIGNDEVTAVKQYCHEDFWGYYTGPADRLYYPRGLLERVFSHYSLRHPETILDKCGDRLPVESYGKYGILKRITYPTGGFTDFKFEQNMLRDKPVGGLRVKSISNVAGGVSSVKTYDYGTGTMVADDPQYMMSYDTYSWWNGVGHYHWYSPERFTTCESNPVPNYTGGNAVLYTSVTESYDDGCYTVYDYSMYPGTMSGYDSANENPNFSRSALNDYGGTSPYLKSVSSYEADDTPVTTMSYEYKPVIIKDFCVGNRLVSVFSSRHPSDNTFHSYKLMSEFVNSETVLHSPITAHAFVLDLTAKETTDHTTGVTTRETYTYDSLHRTLQPKTVTMVNSDGRTYKTEYEYAFESDDPVAEAMTDCFYNDAVTGVQTSCGGTPLKENVTRYTSVERDGRQFFYPEYEYESVLGGALNEVVHYCDYDTLGNPRTVIANRADTASVVWGYGSRYPVARVLGLAYGSLPRQAVSALESAVSQSDVSSALASLRGQLSGRALVSGWSHRPLFGVSSAVSANGYAVNYGYTDGGRLSSISDADGIKNLYSYHYGGGASSGNYVESVRRNDMSGGNNATSRRYYDGLGRPSQTVDNAVGASGKTVRTLQEYDLRGRERRGWLPAVGGAMGEVSVDEFARLSASTYGGDAHAYGDRSYDAADRPLRTSTPGDAWHSAGKGKTTAYVANGPDNPVKLYHAALSGSSLVKDGLYPDGTLQGRLDTDEDGRTLLTFTDKRGRKVLERRGGSNDTYFVYDDLDRLRFVLSPQYQESGYKDKYAYEYRYDERGNIVKRILPGCAVDQYWYDGAGRLTFESLQGAAGYSYRFRLYDRYGRLCVQGLCSDCDRSFSGASRTPRVTYTGGQGLLGTGYSLAPQGLLRGRLKLERALYYDGYGFADVSAFQGLAHTTPGSADGLQTGSVTASSDGSLLYAVLSYDVKGRLTSSASTTLGGRVETSSTSYTYTGNPSETAYSLSGVMSASQSSDYYPVCDKPRSSVLSVSLGGRTASQRTALYAYDDLGRPESVARGGSAGTTVYGYDLHGRPTAVSSKAFEEELFYTGGNGEPCYGGGISSVEWRNPNYPKLRGYMYYYDALGRLESAVYGENEGLATNPNRYNETVLEYTENGAIKRFQRRGLKQNNVYGKIDNLNISLDGNRVVHVVDDALPVARKGAVDFTDSSERQTEYTYNADGALTGDANRGIAKIDYDACGYPRRVQFMDGSVTEYVYTVTGMKLRTVHRTAVPGISVAFGQTRELTEGETLSADSTDYLGNLILEDGGPSKFLFEGGYCSFDSDGISYHYYDRDHQGNIRAVVNSDGTVEQIMNYYPFGAPFSDNTAMNPDLQPYKYNGKEFEAMHGRNAYDYGARFYDPLLPTWDRMDPLCEKYYHVSPYAYCANDPVNRIDLFGLRDYDMDELDDEEKWKQFDVNKDRIVLDELEVIKKDFWERAATLLSDIDDLSQIPMNSDKLIKSSTKSRMAWEAKKYVTNNYPWTKPYFKGFHPSHYYKAATKGYNFVAKYAGKLGSVGETMSIIQILNSKQISFSNVVGGAIYVSTIFIPFGWVIAGGYAFVDVVTFCTTGNNVDKYLDTFSENYFGLENGVLLDFND